MNFFHIPPLLLVLLIINLKASILGHSHHEVGGASRIRCFENERQALLRIKEEFVETNGQLSSWGSEQGKRDCCKWKGVKCHNQTNHVTRLDLHNEFGFFAPPLKGTISTSLLELHHLQYLDLSFNCFDYTPIPEFFGSLSELRYLNLSGAYFGGPIPHHLGNLSKLSYLDLSDNDCSSESLDWVSRLHLLEYLDLGGTNLSNPANWLQAINKLSSIKELYLGSCELTDIHPSSLPSVNASAPLSVLYLTGNKLKLTPLPLLRWFSNFSNTGLTSIDLSNNTVSGPIPNVFQNMTSLAHLDLSQNDLQGGIPNFFGNMSSLVYLDLSDNNLTGDFLELVMNLSGPVEEKLEHLDISYNSITGLFSNVSMFSCLRELKLRENQLNGIIQEGYLKLPHLLELDLSANQLMGPLPHDILFSSSLKELNLRKNQFNGTLTESIGLLSKLEYLQLSSNHLEGTITEAHMFNLSQLQVLDLSSNPLLTVKCRPYWRPPFQLRLLRLQNCRLGPHFPVWLKTQKGFRGIDISNTGISDNIPSWFGGIVPQLTFLNASNNLMYGLFPNFSKSFTIFKAFYPDVHPIQASLDLSSNKLSGSINFLCKTKEWELLDLSDNMFFGQIPDCFTHFKGLKYLNLVNNNFSGKIPHSFGSLSALSLLYLRNNSFSGKLPNSMANCTNLVVIDFGKNRLIGNIPAWLGERFSQLKVLILRFNEFVGSIPSNLCDLAKIQVLDVSSNKISGFIPNCVDKYMAMTRKENDNMSLFITSSVMYYENDPYKLESVYFMWKGTEAKYINNLGLVRLIDLSSNNLVGQIPSQITKLVSLVGLNLSRNNLTGSIPRSIGQMKLDFLDFSRNQLSGSIPTSIGELSFLGVLNLFYNNLSGRIPRSIKLQTFGESAYMGNPGLCGFPLNKSCPGDESIPDLDSGNNAISKEEFEDDDLISQEFYIALWLGFVVGFLGIFGLILLNKAVQYAFVKVLNAVEDFVYVKVEITKGRLLRYFKKG